MTLASLIPVILMAGVFFLPISIGISQLFIFSSILLWLIHKIKTRELTGSKSIMTWMILLFASTVVLSLITGIRCEESIKHIHRLALLLLILLIPDISQPDTIKKILLAFIAGTLCLGLFDLVRFSIHIQQGNNPFNAGNMRDPQFYLCALCFLFVLYKWPISGKWRFIIVAVSLICLAGLLLHYKRGVWFSTASIFFFLCVVMRRYKILLASLCIIPCLAFLPVVQERLAELQHSFKVTKGGRWSLWTNVAPCIFKEYPFGIGYKATTFEDFKKCNWNVAPDLDHLHNNALQITAELGYLGLLVWLSWMTSAFVIFCKSIRRLKQKEHSLYLPILGVLGAFLGLMLNGLVEYNFGDGEIYMLFCVLLGVGNMAWIYSKTNLTMEKI